MALTKRRATIKRHFAEWREDAINVPVPDDVPDDEINGWAIENYDELFGLAFDNQQARLTEDSATIEEHGGDTGPQLLWTDENPTPVMSMDDDYEVDLDQVVIRYP